MNTTPTKLETICRFRTGKLDSNAAIPNGQYPFFTCAQETAKIDEAAFDTEAVLLGGNNAAGIYPLKYYNGIFNAYQRTYVIESLNNDVLAIRYLYYALQPALAHFQSISIGASTQYLTKSVLNDFVVHLPPRVVQDAIVAILSAYDDLIENNRRRMALLEEAARQLYREWFVRLRFPGHEHTRITSGVPVGWVRDKVANLLAKIEAKHRIPKEAYLSTGPIPCVDQSADFIGGFTDDEEAVYSAPLPLIVFGDHTRILKFVNFEFARGADGTQVIYPNTERISTEYLYFALKEIGLSNYFYARHYKFLKDKEVLLPGETLVREFTLFAKPVFDQVQSLRSQNEKLRTAHSLLLPRLMSGELAV